MKKNSKRLLTMSLSVLLAALSLGLTSCGGGADPTTGGDTPTTGGGNVPTTSGGGAPSTSVKPNDPILETDSIKDDVTKDADGLVEFDEEVQIRVWSIIGDPDQVKFQAIVDQFNEDYLGEIKVNITYQGHFDYYTALDTTWKNDFESFPDVCFMHNEKTTEYAAKGYLYPLDSLYDRAGVPMDFTDVYENIDRVTKYAGHRFAVPVDAHGFLTYLRQDIIKKNGLGFEGNTRFIPNSRAEYQSLLEGLRAKADAGELLIRNINRGQDHTWKKASKDAFFPSFHQSTDPDGLSALYANGGSMLNGDQKKIGFNKNNGFVTYVTDQVERYNNRLIGESATNQEMFAAGNTIMFTEGPWWASNTFEGSWNNSELRTAGSNGVTAEDAADPVYSKPFIASHPNGWWTLEENASNENANKWYGNGHAVSITRHATSMQKVAAALTFIKYYTQGYNEQKKMHNLTNWCSSGHIPAWKNVYESEDYKKMVENNVTCKALGNPEDIIAMEGIVYESTIFSALADAIAQVQTAYKSAKGCTVDQAKQIINDVVESAEFMLDMM